MSDRSRRELSPPSGGASSRAPRVPAGSGSAPSPGRCRRVLFITDFYQEEVLLGVVEYARLCHWELITNMRFHGMFPSESEADGILVTGYSERVQEWMGKWRETPAVHLGMAPPELPVPWVDVDYEQAARAGARHLMELGHLNYAFYALVNPPDTKRVREAFMDELEGRGCSATSLDFEALHGSAAMEVPREERLRWLARRLGELRRPLAVMTDDDRRSLELVKACEMLGLRIPEDVSILGCENRTVEVGMSRVPLSSVDMNWRMVGREAARRLDDQMEGRRTSDDIRVPPRGVIARASTATFVTRNPAITRTLLHIRQHSARSLKMKDLARTAGMSERQFREEFKRLVGHSPRTEIHRARLATATRLLRDTELKLDAIAVESGFGSAKKLCEVFAEDYLMTPTAWRLQGRVS